MSYSVWYQGFQASSPLMRHTIVRDFLANQAQWEEVTSDDFAAAVVSVCQMLAEHNQLTELAELVRQLKAQTPELATLVLPAWHQLALQDALYQDRTSELSEHLEALLLAPAAGIQWPAILDEMAFYGQGELAAQWAFRLESALDPEELARNQELAYALEQHQVFDAMGRYWGSNRQAADHQAFVATLLAADLDPEDFEAIVQLRDATPLMRIAAIKQGFRERDLDAALLPSQLAFGQWAHGLGLDPVTAAAMVEAAFGLWDLAPEAKRPEFDKWLKIKAEDFHGWASQISHEDPHAGFVLLWGLPHVGAWLSDQGLASMLLPHYLNALLPPAKSALFAKSGHGLWTASFVHRWPRPAAVSEADFTAEQLLFAASRNQTEALSEDPSAGQTFDGDAH